MKKICCFILSFCAVTLGLNAQTITETLELARQHFQREEYALAQYQLERVVFFSEDDSITALAYHLSRQGYIAQQNWSRALRIMDLEYNLTENEQEQAALLLEKATIELSLQSYDAALHDIVSAEPGEHPDLQRLKKACLASCYFGLNQFDSSKVYFLQLLPADSIQVELLFQKVRKAGRLNPNLAQWMSVFLPGLGQFYAGDIRNGINSLLLNTGLVVAAIYLAEAWTILDSFALVGPWFIRYYQGGIQRAPISVENRIRKKRAGYYAELMKLLQTQSARS